MKTKKTKIIKNKKRKIDGILKDFSKEQITLNVANKELIINTKNIANMKLKYNW